MSGSAELVSRLLKQSIITLCRETVSYQSRLEVDGIICLAVDSTEQHVVKIHEIFNAEPSALGIVKEEPRISTPETVRSPSPLRTFTNGSTPEPVERLTHEKRHGDSNCTNSSYIHSQLFETASIRESPDHTETKPELETETKDHILKESPTTGTVEKDKLTVSNATNIPCKKCGKTIEDVPTYENHNLVAHGHFTCLICLSTFTSRNNMKRHIRLHTGVKPYVCHKCPESFSRNDDFKRHLLRHTFQKPFRCAICQIGYSDRSSVRMHMLKEHTSSMNHVCPQCGECYDDTKKFQEHKKTHLEFLDYRCSLCAFTGSNALMYNKHMLTHGPPKQYTCRHCEISFSDPFTYTDHLKKHKGEELVQEFGCCFCELTLPTFEQFQRHEHSHVHSKQHTCNICHKHFRYPSNLREHMLTHIPKSDLINATKDPTADPKNYRADTEDNDETKTVQENHLKKVNNETEDTVDETEENNNVLEKADRPYDFGSEYWCTECQHGFGTEGDLQNHILSQHEQTGADRSFQETDEDDDVIPATQIEVNACPYDSATQVDTVQASLSHKGRALRKDESGRINKRKSNSIGRPFPVPKRNRVYDEETVVDEVRSNMNIALPVLPEFGKDLTGQASINKTEKQCMMRKNDNKNKKFEYTLRHVDDGDEKLKSEISRITNVIPGLKPVKRTFAVENRGEADTESKLENEDSGLGHYSKSSVLGMDTEFSASPNRASPTTINLKVRNPGFEKVITPDILFETKAPFTCEICKENFGDFPTFDQHGVKVHRRFICSYCGKAFTSRPNRERHVRYHTGEKPYKCDLCPVSFFRGDDLKYHRTTKHSDVKPFTCGACHSSFSYPKDLEKHLRVHPDHKL